MAQSDRFRNPLLACFKDAHDNGDAQQEKVFSRSNRKESSELLQEAGQGEAVLSAAGRFNRRGMTEAEFRQSILESLSDIVSTIDLQSALDLDGLPHVTRSVINYGLFDITHLTSDDANFSDIERNIVGALTFYEPRLIAQSIAVTTSTEFNDVSQKLKIAVHAEASHDRHVVPLEFVAEIDLGSSKVTIGRASS